MKKILFIILLLISICAYSEAGVDTFNDDVTVSGAMTANGSLAVVGSTTFASDVTITGNLSVAGYGGQIMQISNVLSRSVATGTTAIPFDDSIPQKTEGTEVMALAFTPRSATSKLKIEVVAVVDSSGDDKMTVALFQDDTAGALAAVGSANNPNDMETLSFIHYMTSGTTSETTFKVHIGDAAGGTVTFNGAASGRIYGGVSASSITITEIGA